jgi:hypothetical protein
MFVTQGFGTESIVTQGYGAGAGGAVEPEARLINQILVSSSAVRYRLNKATLTAIIAADINGTRRKLGNSELITVFNTSANGSRLKTSSSDLTAIIALSADGIRIPGAPLAPEVENRLRSLLKNRASGRISGYYEKWREELTGSLVEESKSILDNLDMSALSNISKIINSDAIIAKPARGQIVTSGDITIQGRKSQIVQGAGMLYARPKSKIVTGYSVLTPLSKSSTIVFGEAKVSPKSKIVTSGETIMLPVKAKSKIVTGESTVKPVSKSKKRRKKRKKKVVKTDE